ncbi:MAG: host attachment protein [Ferrovibrio sp.]|uniref:host attachment protein n=1 Tax=Ferrovibrio sp. TaxID=1917215 RepID=UPI003918B37D
MAFQLPIPTWILVTDASQAHVYEISILAGPLRAVPGYDMTAADTHGFSRDLKSDKPGRAFASTGQRSAMEPRHDPHQMAEDKFAKSVAERLNHACEEKLFAQLVVIAPPRMLGVLRDEFSAAVQKLVAAEIHKDLVKADNADILAHVKAELS